MIEMDMDIAPLARSHTDGRSYTQKHEGASGTEKGSSE